MTKDIFQKILDVLLFLLGFVLIFTRYARYKELIPNSSLTTMTDITVISLLIVMILRYYIIMKKK